ncbi:uncharacterized protein LOC141905411 [Tubulanus polymorphus]|uniref:uncharacterized protein LOC141905411 n=1 Tax=Tubulanus polymorphus TaxID=672921 RepID=UPI003DA2F6A6
MDKFVGRWEYHHDLSPGEDVAKFAEGLKLDKEELEEMSNMTGIMEISKHGKGLRIKVFLNGKFDHEFNINLDGTESDFKIHDGRQAKGLFSIKDGKLCGENIKILDVQEMIMEETMEVEGDWIKMTTILPKENFTTVSWYKKI